MASAHEHDAREDTRTSPYRQTALNKTTPRTIMSTSSSSSSSLNLNAWIESIKDTLKPPVGNRLLFSGQQLKVMVVAGPNERNDFHIEKGEELFYMLQGDMNLDIMEQGRRVRIPIKEGQFFLLPANVPHSPQRYANTIGIVFERERLMEELDCLRWYVPETEKAEILYEEVFRCTDLGTQIKEVIERYNGLNAEGKLDPSSSASSASIPGFGPSVDYFKVSYPGFSSGYPSFLLAEALAKMASNDGGSSPSASASSSTTTASSTSSSCVSLVDSEFKLYCIVGSNSATQGAEVPVTEVPCDVCGETFLWQLTGASEILTVAQRAEGSAGPGVKSDSGRKLVQLQSGEVTLLSRRSPTAESESITIRQLQPGVTLCVTNAVIPPL